MIDADLRNRAQDVFRAVFDKQDLVISDTMQAKDVEGWDSLAHITLIMSLEEQFHIKFTTREVMGFNDVGEMLNSLQDKLR